MPVNIEAQVNRFLRVLRNLTQKLECEPAPHEIADEMLLSTEQVMQFETIIQPPTSLESKVGSSEDGSILKDLIEDTKTISPVERIQIKKQRKQIAMLLAKLSEQEQKVLAMRFGLKDGDTKSLEAIGQSFGLSRDKIRQIESIALKKLRRLVSPDDIEMPVSGHKKGLFLRGKRNKIEYVHFSKESLTFPLSWGVKDGKT